MSATPPGFEGSRVTQRRVQHALGYTGLEMWRAALAELGAIAAEERELPLVRAARVDYHMARRQWREVVRRAAPLAREHPWVESAWIGWAYALRELQRIAEARAVLLQAEAHHGDASAVLHYNLACYDSLLGDLASSRRRLKRACRMDPHFQHAAQADPDLVALRATGTWR
jgi:hypothetical protein